MLKMETYNPCAVNGLFLYLSIQRGGGEGGTYRKSTYSDKSQLADGFYPPNIVAINYRNLVNKRFIWLG